MAPDLLLAGAIGGALCLYFLFGGADFGGGVWDLLARGPRAAAQRRAVAAAIGPVWEANHVWLILVIVMLFSGFPPAFAAISVALHVPLTLFLIGVVLRGSAFAFRSLDMSGDPGQRRFGLMFSMASTIAPVLLGDDRRRARLGQHPRLRTASSRAASSRPGSPPSRSRSGCSRWRCARCWRRPTSPSSSAIRRCARTSGGGRWPRRLPSA